MKVTQKIELIRRIGKELIAQNYTFDEVDVLLEGFNLETPRGNWNDWDGIEEYSRFALRKTDDATIIKISKEFNIINQSPNEIAVSNPPKIWAETKKFKLFISHLAEKKTEANRLKDTLAKYHISAFVAHEDIHPDAEWQSEIECALQDMDAMLAIHTPKFSNSFWTQQEIGFALGRSIKVVSFKMGEDPKGFISKKQAILWKNRKAEVIAKEVHAILLSDTATKSRMAEVEELHTIKEDDEIPF